MHRTIHDNAFDTLLHTNLSTKRRVDTYGRHPCTLVGVPDSPSRQFKDLPSFWVFVCDLHMIVYCTCNQVCVSEGGGGIMNCVSIRVRGEMCCGCCCCCRLRALRLDVSFFWRERECVVCYVQGTEGSACAPPIQKKSKEENKQKTHKHKHTPKHKTQNTQKNNNQFNRVPGQDHVRASH